MVENFGLKRMGQKLEQKESLKNEINLGITSVE